MKLCLRLDLVLIRAGRFSNKIQYSRKFELEYMHRSVYALMDNKHHVTYGVRKATKMWEIWGFGDDVHAGR